ncbi:Protein of unknown function, partial [Gryllus bimaculatus]
MLTVVCVPHSIVKENTITDVKWIVYTNNGLYCYVVVLTVIIF